MGDSVKDDELITLLRLELISGLERSGLSDFDVQQSHQSTQQGISSRPVIYIHKITDVREGSPGHIEQYNADSNEMERITTEVLISMYQISGSTITDAASQSTTSDLVKRAARVMQSPEYQSALVSRGVNVMRVTTVNNVDVSGGTPGYAQRPIFELHVNHSDSYTTIVPCTQSIKLYASRI